MKKLKTWIIAISVICLAFIMITTETRAESEYKPDKQTWNKHKNLYDDPNPFLKTYGWKQIIPAGEYAKLTFDIETMKNTWAKVVGFRSPDVVGKIAPEIKPGKYTYKDKEKYPGLKELMIPTHYERFNPGAPPLALNFPEIEIVPTQQVYHSLPVANATLKNMGKTQLDDKGYMKDETYESGFPFPQSSGKFKAQQIVYNWQERYNGGDQFLGVEDIQTFDRKLKLSFSADCTWEQLKLGGRCTIPPYGYYDKRAQEKKEIRVINFRYLSPRDQAGNVIWIINKRSLDEPNQLMVWLAQIRRVRKLSAADSQDTAAGSNEIFDDFEGFNQKLSPTVYPYKFELLAEREFLVPHHTTDGAEYVSSKGIELRNLRLERRPMYVVKMTQQDPTYVYGYRILYIDKETFAMHRIETHDQKGRLWRSVDPIMAFIPEGGFIWPLYFLTWNYIDPQVEYCRVYQIPVTWMTRNHLSLSQLEKKGK